MKKGSQLITSIFCPEPDSTPKIVNLVAMELNGSLSVSKNVSHCLVSTELEPILSEQLLEFH